jgi:hypothetical protein
VRNGGDRGGFQLVQGNLPAYGNGSGGGDDDDSDDGGDDRQT